MSMGINNIKPAAPQQPQKKHLTNNFETRLRNSADMNDCIAVPRTIFKGYLGVMFGTTLATVAGMMKKSKLKTGMALSAIALSTYGTWSFARPYVLKGAVPNVQPKTKA